MARKPFAQIIAAAFAENPELAEEFYISASEILHDFDCWGPVIQANEHGEYDETTELVKLRAAYEGLSEKIAALQDAERTRGS